MFFSNNDSSAQTCNYKLSGKNEIKETHIYGEELMMDYSIIKKKKESDIEVESALAPALTIVAAALPKILNFTANTVKRKIKKNLEKYEKQYEFRQTVIYPTDSDGIDEIILQRNVLEKGKKEISPALTIILKRISESDNIYRVNNISLPISKAKGDSEIPYLNIKIELELIFFDHEKTELVTQKSSPIEIPLIKIGVKNQDLSSKKIYSSRFTNSGKPIEIKAKITEYNPSKARYDDIKTEVNEITSDTKEITEALTLGILNEILGKLKKDEKIKDEGGEPENDSGM